MNAGSRESGTGAGVFSALVRLGMTLLCAVVCLMPASEVAAQSGCDAAQQEARFEELDLTLQQALTRASALSDPSLAEGVRDQMRRDIVEDLERADLLAQELRYPCSTAFGPEDVALLQFGVRLQWAGYLNQDGLFEASLELTRWMTAHLAAVASSPEQPYASRYERAASRVAELAAEAEMGLQAQDAGRQTALHLVESARSASSATQAQASRDGRERVWRTRWVATASSAGVTALVGTVLMVVATQAESRAEAARAEADAGSLARYSDERQLAQQTRAAATASFIVTGALATASVLIGVLRPQAREDQTGWTTGPWLPPSTSERPVVGFGWGVRHAF